MCLDLIPYISNAVRIRRVITLGSPVAHPEFENRYRYFKDASPVRMVDSWVNFWGDGDFVCGGHGISSLLPEVLDIKLKMGWTEHETNYYLPYAPVGRAIVDALVA